MELNKIISYLRIATSIFLGLILLIAIIIIINYSQEVKEVMGLKAPDRLMELYEKKTNTQCLCANPKFGMVTFIPIPQP